MTKLGFAPAFVQNSTPQSAIVKQNSANSPKGKLGRNVQPRGTRRSKWSRLNTTISRHCRKQQSGEGMRCANSLKTLEGAARLSDVCCCHSNNVSCVDSFLHRSGKCCPGRSPYYRYLDHCHHYCKSMRLLQLLFLLRARFSTSTCNK